MSQEKIKRVVHLVYGIFLSVLLCAVGILLITMCVDIYKSGPSPFTRESVGEHFAKIAFLVYIFIFFVIGGGILNIVAPIEGKLKGNVSDALVLERLRKKLTSVSSEGAEKIEKQRILRLVLVIISGVLITGVSVFSFIHIITTFDASQADINGEVIKGCLSILRYFTVPLAYLIFTVYACKSSVKKELEVVKNELKSKSDAENGELGTFTKISYQLNDTKEEIQKPKKWHRTASLVIKCAVAAVAIVFVILGVINGGMDAVVVKAINICTECIGMG